MTHALCTSPERSAKWSNRAKGAKGAVYFACSLLHTSGSSCSIHGRLHIARQDCQHGATPRCTRSVGLFSARRPTNLLGGRWSAGADRRHAALYLSGEPESPWKVERLLARLLTGPDEQQSAQQTECISTAARIPHQVTTDLIALLVGIA